MIDFGLRASPFFRRPSLSVLFVCRANVCRSPMAQGMLRQLLEQEGLIKKIRVDSAGTHAAQPGRRADARAQRACRSMEIDIESHRARQVISTDFGRYQYIIALDESNLAWLMSESPQLHRDKIHLLGEWGDTGFEGIPDPYYGNFAGFTQVLVMLREPLEAFLRVLKNDPRLVK